MQFRNINYSLWNRIIGIMNPSSSEKIRNTQANYDHLSRWYDWLEGWGEKRICDQTLNLLNPGRNERILEIGSGTGANLIRLNTLSTGLSLIGADLSLEMCRQAMKKLNRIKINHIVFSNVNATNLPFPANTFDAILMMFTLEILPNETMLSALQDCRKVLKKKGRICVACMADEKTRSPMMSLYRWSMRVFPRVVDCRPIKANEMIQSVGFTIEIIQHHSLWGLPVTIVLAKN